MSMYASPNGNGLQAEGPKANQACLTCRKQKRKCNKALPACALCERMNRPCDYSDAAPPPTSEDFNALRMMVKDLEARLNMNNGGINSPAHFATPSTGALSEQQILGAHLPSFNPPPEIPWQAIQNRFPAIAFLDSDSFKNGGVTVPKPAIEIPLDVLELLGDGISIQAVINEYFATTHKWMPIVSHKRLTRNMANPLWEAGPDLALLFLAMKLIISRPQDGIESSHNPLYLSTKRFITVLEAAGAASLLILQANLLVTWYEYGQSIYPAAYMSAGWCVRYGNLLGINGHSEAPQLLGRMGTWTEQEERRRAWWGVLVVDRIVSKGGQAHVLNSQEPEKDDSLPVNDQAWDEGEMPSARAKWVSSPVEESVAPFPRLCQASVMMGKVLSHHYGEKIPSETATFGLASQLYVDISLLARKLTEESISSEDFLLLSSPLALSFSALCTLCDAYTCPRNSKNCAEKRGFASTEAVAMQAQAIDGLRTVSRSIVEFADQVTAATSSPQDLDRVSPIIMDALYSAASSYAWIVRESGEEGSQMALDSLRHCLRRLGGRWRNAAEYLRILEAQEFTYAVGSAAS